MAKPRYSEFSNRIDVDAFERAINWEPIDHDERRDLDRGHCPDPWGMHAHGDTTGKFAILRDVRRYHCWVCGGGSLLSLAMEIMEMDVDDATHWLKQFATASSDEDNFEQEFLALIADVEKRVETLPYFNAKMLDRFTPWAKDASLSWPDLCRPFAEKWGISEDVVEHYQLGYDPEHSRRVKDELYIGPALIFPHFWQERLVGWQERWLASDDERPQWVPKYTNTTDLPRNSTLFNYDKALKRRSERTVIVESVPTALALVSHGYNSVATFGSNITDAQLRLLKRFGAGVILGPDNDIPNKREAKPAGLKWRDQITEYLTGRVRVYWVDPPEEFGPSADLADLARLGKPTLDRHMATAHEPHEELWL